MLPISFRLHFGFVSLVLFGLVFQYRAKNSAGKNLSEMTYFVWSGTWIPAPYQTIPDQKRRFQQATWLSADFPSQSV